MYSMVITMVKVVEEFLARLCSELYGLPAPLVTAKLVSILDALAREYVNHVGEEEARRFFSQLMT